MAIQRETMRRNNSSFAKMTSLDSNSTLSTGLLSRTSVRMGAVSNSPTVTRPKVTAQSGRSVAPSKPSVLLTNPAFSPAAHKSVYV